MRQIIMTALLVLLASPVFAQSNICNINGPDNCTQQSEDVLVDLTHNAIDRIQLTQDPHPFKTKNDEVLQAYAASRATAQNTVKAPSDDRDWTFWR